jgi:predicted membrane protein
LGEIYVFDCGRTQFLWTCLFSQTLQNETFIIFAIFYAVIFMVIILYGILHCNNLMYETLMQCYKQVPSNHNGIKRSIVNDLKSKMKRKYVKDREPSNTYSIHMRPAISLLNPPFK